jgi:hypothetical protein
MGHHFVLFLNIFINEIANGQMQCVARPLGPALSVSPALSSLSTFPVDFAKP